MNSDKKKLKVLVSAFACFPPVRPDADKGESALGTGESILGWNLVRKIGCFHNVWIITQGRYRKGIEQFLQEHPSPQLHFSYLNIPLVWKPFWKTPFLQHVYYYFWQRLAYGRARTLHRLIGFDLAHHLTFANDWMPSFIGGKLRVPFIWGPIGGGQKYPPQFLRDFGYSARLKEFGRVAAQWWGRTVLPSRRQTAKRARAILVCNREARATIPARYRDKVRFFPVTGATTDDLAALPLIKPEDGLFRIMTTGRLVRYKCFDFALMAYALFVKARPDFPSHFEIIGQGPEEKVLRKLVDDLGLADRVNFIPWLSRKDVIVKMAASDVFLFPSLREGGGIVIIEAMASGTPVIGIDAAGPGFHIQREWGIKIAPLEKRQVIRELSEALVRLSQDPALRRRLGEAARKRAEEYYIWDRLGERLMVIYEEVLERGLKT